MPATDPGRDVWNGSLLRNPHEVADKRMRIQKMFAAIAPSYDINNRLHSLGKDQAWRQEAVKLANVKDTDVVVDVACGTGDLTIKFYDAVEVPDPWGPWPPKPGQIMGIDFTYQMLPLAKAKSWLG